MLSTHALKAHARHPSVVMSNDVQLQNKYYAADAIAVDHTKQTVTCKEISEKTFDVRYDVLAIATGSQGRCP